MSDITVFAFDTAAVRVVTVDGEPVRTGEGVNEADRQRCTDVALERSDIQIKYDDLAAKPLLNAWVEKDLTLRGEAVRFRGWSNYVYWIKRAEVRGCSDTYEQKR